MKPCWLLMVLLGLPSMVAADNLQELLDSSRGAVDAAVDQNNAEAAAQREAARQRDAQAALQPESCKIKWIQEDSMFQGDFAGNCTSGAFAGTYSEFDNSYTVSGPAGSRFGPDRSDAILRACGCY